MNNKNQDTRPQQFLWLGLNSWHGEQVHRGTFLNCRQFGLKSWILLAEIFEEDVAKMGWVFNLYEHSFCMPVVQGLWLACLHLKSGRSGNE